ncbi:MAG: multiple antibiotic resistance protein, partial [Planctomycetota bacterium]
GGLIIASSGFALLTGKFAEHKGMKKKRVQHDIESREEISLTPLAIPMIAGPGTISLLIAYNQEFILFSEIIQIVVAMILAALSIFLILRSSHLIVKVFGASGINALSRIIGFIVIAIGVEFIVSAIINILTEFI